MERTHPGGHWQKTLFLVGALVGTAVLLNFPKSPLLPELDPSWVAAITFAAEHKLQFGSEIIYTYGPLGHLAFSTYSPSLFVSDLLLEIFIKGTYATVVSCLSLRLPLLSRVCFLLAAFLLAALSYQALYIFAIVCAGWILLTPSQTNNLLFLPAWALVAIAALIKITFLWFALFTLFCGAAICLFQGRIARAITALAITGGAVLTAWILSGQALGNLPVFLRTAVDVTSGYSKTMSLPCLTPILVMGLATCGLILVQLTIHFLSEKQFLSAGCITLILTGALFLNWKIGFSRADAHTVHFFLFAPLLAIAIPRFYKPANFRLTTTNWMIAGAVVGLSSRAISLQDPGIPSRIGSNLVAQWTSTLEMLLRPSTEINKWRTINRENSLTFDLPRIKKAVGSSSVDVFGNEQSIAILNGLNYRPIPTIQTYCDYTPTLALINAAFYRSPRAPEYVIFKLQPIDNRLPTINCSEVFVRLLCDYDPLLSERGYLLLKRQRKSETPLVSELRHQSEGEAKVGEPISVPDGNIWCELELKETLAGKLLGFLYHSPVVRLATTNVDGETSQWRILPGLARNGFLVNPVPSSEKEFVQVAMGNPPTNLVTRTIQVVRDSSTNTFFHPRVAYRFSEIPVNSNPRPFAATLPAELNYADVLSTPASRVKSEFPLARFAIDKETFLLVHPKGEVRFEIPTGATSVTGEFAMRPETYLSGRTDGVEFRVEFVLSKDTTLATTLFQKELRPLTVEADRGIQRFLVDLPSNPIGELVLRTLPGAAGNFDWDWAGWSKVQFEPHGVTDSLAR